MDNPHTASLSSTAVRAANGGLVGMERFHAAAAFTSRITGVAYFKDLLGLEQLHYRPTAADAQELDCLIGWEHRRDGRKAKRYARRYNLPYLGLEYGFLRSLGLGVPPLSFVIDDCGIYHDAARPSRLENILNTRGWEREALRDRARSLIARIRADQHSRGHLLPDVLPGRSNAPKVLLIDQSLDDRSVAGGLADVGCFQVMLREALLENPDSDILIQLSPEAQSGSSKSFLADAARHYRVFDVPDGTAPLVASPQIERVYTVTAQQGFEALLHGKPVSCFGLPYYAGWGLTQDYMGCERRSQSRNLEDLFVAAYILYARYIHPQHNRVCDIEQVLEYSFEQRRWQDAGKGKLYCIGFPFWRRQFVRNTLQMPEPQLVFVTDYREALRKGLDASSRIICREGRLDDDTWAKAKDLGVPVWQMQDQG